MPTEGGLHATLCISRGSSEIFRGKIIRDLKSQRGTVRVFAAHWHKNYVADRFTVFVSSMGSAYLLM
jgi:hypothetical protein